MKEVNILVVLLLVSDKILFSGSKNVTMYDKETQFCLYIL